MATQKWIPISTDLKENGSFLALSHLRNSDELTPVPLGDNIQYSEFSVIQQQVDTKIAASMGLFNLLKVEANSNVFTFLYEASIYSNIMTSMPIGDLIYGTRYGTGYRLMLKATKLDLSTNLSITSIAAQATLGRASVQFEIHGFGFPNDASILADAPNPADFNVDTWARISEYTTKVKDYLKNNISNLTPKPYQILANPNKVIDTTYEFQSYLYAYIKIKNRSSLKQAIRQSKNKYSDSIIKDVYSFLDISDEEIIPSLNQAHMAESLINI